MRLLPLVLLVPACAGEVVFPIVNSGSSTGESSSGGLATTDEPVPTTSASSSSSSGAPETGDTSSTQGPTGDSSSSSGDSEDSSSGSGGSSSGEGTEGSSSTGEPPIESCLDGVKNQDETDIDCGGASCPSCGLDAACLIDIDCASSWCSELVCTQPECLADSDCDALDLACMDASCDLESKTCTLAASNEGLACEDGDLCTLDQTCAAGSCVGGSLVDCSGVDSSCGLGLCEAKTGACIGQAFPDSEGDACDDGFVCTPNDVCAAGLCGVGGPGYLFFEDFTDPHPDWEFGPLWEVGPALISVMGTNGADPEFDHSPGDDNMLAGTLIGELVPAVTQALTCMTSPQIDASGQTQLWLSFWRHLHTDYFPFVKHYVDVFDGEEWQNVEIGYANPGIDDPEWSFQQYDLTAYMSTLLRVRICYERDDMAFIHAGWSVDDLTIGPFVCTPEP